MLRQIEVGIANGKTTPQGCKEAEINVQTYYRRDAEVIWPAVEVSAGHIAETAEDYYLMVGVLADYKQVDLAIETCNRLGRSLRIIGTGEQLQTLRRLAGPTVRLLGDVPDAEIKEHYAHCRALLFPGEEDFGIVPVEANSFGRPVIAYGRGGVLETVSGFFAEEHTVPEHSTGVFFAEQSVEYWWRQCVFSKRSNLAFRRPSFARIQRASTGLISRRRSSRSFHRQWLSFRRSNWAEGNRRRVTRSEAGAQRA